MKNLIAAGYLLGLATIGASATVLSPEHEALSQSLFTVPEGQARIVILRAEDATAVIGTDVKIDGVSLESPIGKSLLMKDVEPGKHKITAYAQRMVTIEVEAKAGEIVYVQQRQTFGRLQRHAKLKQIQMSQGEREAWGRN